MVLMAKLGFRTSDVHLHTREGKLSFVAVIIMLYTMALFVSVALHEIFGHGLAAVLVGGDFYAVFVTPGSGYASIYLPTTISNVSRAFVYLAGILVEICVGLVVLYLVLPRLKGFLSSLFALVLGGVMLVHPSIYLFLGSFYDKGDTSRAVAILGVPTDLFVVLGLIMAGTFTLLVSMAALNFLGHRMGNGDEASNIRALLMFWIPQIILGMSSAIAAAVFLTRFDLTYTMANACVLLLFIGVAIFMVPHVTEPRDFKEHRMSMKSVFATLVCFMLVLSVWIGTFGVTDSSAHGLLLTQRPPVEVEPYYNDYRAGDYSIGNVDIFIGSNGTAEVSITLRNIMDRKNHSTLDKRIYESFNERPYWDYYIERSRYMLIVMFGLSREVGENLSFTTGLGDVRAGGIDDDYGRRCTTPLSFEFRETFFVEGVRQADLGHTAGGTDESLEALSLQFDDPWAAQGGYLDEVRISWDQALNLTFYSASNAQHSHIIPDVGNISDPNIDSVIGWMNTDPESSPTTYRFILRRAQEI